SSRRRHTRFSRDWSSDVCSSDLAGAPVVMHSTTTKSKQRAYASPRGPRALASRTDIVVFAAVAVLMLTLVGWGGFATDSLATVTAEALEWLIEIGRASCRETGWITDGAGPAQGQD